MEKITKTVADFYAGMGLVSYGLAKQGWVTEYAVDYSEQKKEMYEGHFGVGHYHLKDVADVKGADIPSVILAHASFPCTDMSVAGGREGFAGIQSASLWNFARIISEMAERKPSILLLENVEGLLTSNNGQDLLDTLGVLNDMGYAVDITLINAAHFVPQSRVRMFIIGKLAYPRQTTREVAEVLSLQTSARPRKIKDFILANKQIRWHLKGLPELPTRHLRLEQVIDLNEEWWSQQRTDYLIQQMYAQHHQLWVQNNIEKLEYVYGTVFRRMRMQKDVSKSTAELRTDGIAGCLRTPKGGSAKQILLRVGKGSVSARLLNVIECARLMGAPDYRLSKDLNFSQALFGFGDAVCADVVAWLAEHYLDQLVNDIAVERVAPVQQSVNGKLVDLLSKYNERVLARGSVSLLPIQMSSNREKG